MGRTSTHSDFLAKAIAKHGHRYDYSQAVYLKSFSKVKIGCPTHGLFEQGALKHTQGRGCPKCALSLAPVYALKDSATIIARFRKTHGDKYDYTLVSYTGGRHKVKIICPLHGVFEQAADSHARGSGCSECSGNKPLTRVDFIARFHKTHGEKYDYSLAVFRSVADKVKIICPQHGEFEQSPDSHGRGIGCPSCGRQRTGEAHRMEWLELAQGRLATLYFLRLSGGDEVFFKIGITFDSVRRRFSKAVSLATYQYEILALHQSTDASRVWGWERSILETFAHLSYKPKVNFGGASECFSSCEEILAIFPL